MIKTKYTKGFTLVELLVVIAIIAILAAALFLVINPANLMEKSRDARRISELTEVNKALAAALADGKLTPPTLAVATRSSCTGTFVVTGAGWVGGWAAGGTMGDFMTVLPRDPRNVAPLCYEFAWNASGQWEFSAVLESGDNAGLVVNDGGDSGSVAGCTADTMPTTSCKYEIGTRPGLDIIH
ncbi:prepilin-type N-terminal cleavage/methylation domain-containing protein [Patescibacteria group bacterium]|nr:prepilin-type N-terminal cleavage/methylation domain-containing protein [Patescibacteria group bacterium]